MLNNKYLRALVGLCTLVLCMFGMQTAVHAESYTVPLQVLENGTSNTSYAAAYFAHSATVTPNGNNSYTVTSTVTTGKDLGNYPVQVLNIDGAGANVSRSESGNSQTITYSFTTSNLSARHNAAIKVDVNSINYHHNYIVGLMLDASKVPAQKDAASSSSQSQNQSSQASQQSNTANSSSSETNTVSSSSASVASQASQSSETAASDQDNEASSSKKTTSQKKNKTQVSEESHKDQNKQLPVAAILGGGLALGVILGLVFNLKKK